MWRSAGTEELSRSPESRSAMSRNVSSPSFNLPGTSEENHRKYLSSNECRVATKGTSIFILSPFFFGSYSRHLIFFDFLGETNILRAFYYLKSDATSPSLMSDTVTTSSSNTETKHECHTCLISFDCKAAKRAHMKDGWQYVISQTYAKELRESDKHSVYNLKRRITELPPISNGVFQDRFPYQSPEATRTDAAPQSHDETSEALNLAIPSENSLEPISGQTQLLNGEKDNFSPLECLFCNAESTSLEVNLAHMSQAHSFFILDPEYLIDMESLLKYLFTIVSVFHECLFCGTERNSKLGAQDHMRAKGHCKVDFENDEHQLWQFYDFSEDEGTDQEDQITLVPFEDELRLPSGKTLGHRSRARHFCQHRSSRSKESSSSEQRLLTEDGSEAEPEADGIPTTTSDRSLVMRAGTSTSVIGVPQLQQRALRAVEHNMVREEVRVKNEYRHVLERGGNKQKRFRVKSIGKKAGGLEKRLG